MYYPGGKAKTFHHVVNLMPPHRVYIEPFLGLGSVMKAKRRSEIEFGIDLDYRALELSNLINTGIHLVQGDGIGFLEKYPFEGDEVVYCDPPYYPEVRKRSRVYRFDFDHFEHVRFLELVSGLNARIIISGYEHKIYNQYLKSWNVRTFKAKAHDGIREERLWFNFTLPTKLHDYRYLGSNFRERQAIQRRISRIKNRLSNLTAQERSFLQEWLTSGRE